MVVLDFVAAGELEQPITVDKDLLQRLKEVRRQRLPSGAFAMLNVSGRRWC
jgi:hypothetical protein